MNLRLKMLTDEQCYQFHEASAKILSETGIRVLKKEAVDLLKSHGAKVDGDLVRIPTKMLDDCLASCPREFRWTGFNNCKSVLVKQEPLIQPAVGPVFIQDTKKGRRKANAEDYENLIKIMHQLDIVSINGGLPVDIEELPSERKYLLMMEMMLRNTSKPLLGFSLNKQLVQQTMGFFEAVADDDNIWEKGHYLAAVCTPISPLALDEDCIDTVIEYAKRNQIVISASCIMAGISGPVNPLGTAVLQNAEILSGIVLAQCVRSGCPVLYSVASTAGYMKDASFAGGSPDAMLIHGPCIQTAIDLYDLPIRTMTGINSAKEADYQAGMETGMSAMLSGLIGGGVWPQCLGVLDDIMTISYEKLILDCDTIDRALYLRKGLDFSEENLAVNLIDEIGPRGNYLMHRDTFNNYPKLWMPKYMNWDSWETSEKKGTLDLLECAHQTVEQILAESPKTLLSPDQENKIKKAIDQLSL